jgi:Animal haem peroxidase
MARRFRIPFLLDLAIVSDEAEMARLNNEPAVRRGLSGTGPWLHRLLAKRIHDTFRVDGRLLPVFEPRDKAERAEAQERAEQSLTRMAAQARPFDRDAVAALANYVAGRNPDTPIGVTVQQIIGRLFDRSYVATRESYEAARVVNAALSACPINVLRVLWWKLSGRFAASRALIWKRANHDPVIIHSTAIAMHNVVDSLKRMRVAMRKDGAWQATPAQAASEALVAPSRLLRQCVRETELKGPLRPGALVLVRLHRIHKGTESNDLALSRHEWSQCPAHAIVPRLLEDVWQEAVGAVSCQRYRPQRSLVFRLFLVPAIWFFTALNRRLQWYRLPKWLGFVNLAILRSVLRERNLFDTSLLPSVVPGPPPVVSPDVLRWRTADGSFNDLRDPNMGRAGTRFSRNVPLGYTYPHPNDLFEPNPRRVSRMLLARGAKLIEAPSLNVLAAAWTQFQVHDWFAHGNPDPNDPVSLTIPPDLPGDEPIKIGRTRPDRTRSDDPPVGPPTYINRVTHWWDASQLYGSDLDTQRSVRAGHHGKLSVDEHGRLPLNRDGIEVTGVNDNWWLGLSLFHHLFTYEHNAICDRLHAEYPDWDDERLFQTARLINAALIAKIHEIEWTPTVLANATVRKGLHASWWGLLGKWVATHIGRFHASDLLGGIPGSATDHHAAPYAMTEEFVSVYRMHAFMLPDEFEVYSAANPQSKTPLKLVDILGPGARRTVEKLGMGKVGMADVLYSFGRTLPGKLTLGNYAKTLQQFQMPNAGTVVDLAAVDIMRDRERGVPRYNQFRELLHLPPVRSFKELNPQWAETLEKVYGTVDRIDLMVGLFAEAPPPGFGFSDTTFRIFLLMNPRRLKSDRFFTTDYRPAIYTQVGLDWIDGNDLRRVLLRHFPMLEPVLARVSRPFAPWPE